MKIHRIAAAPTGSRILGNKSREVVGFAWIEDNEGRGHWVSLVVEPDHLCEIRNKLKWTTPAGRKEA